MHRHNVHSSYVHPMDGVDNSQWNFHLPDTQHCPAKSFHFLDQTTHCVEHWQQTNTQVDDRQLEHHFYPNYGRKQFPSYLCNRSLLCPLQAHFLQSVSNLLVYKVDAIHILVFKQIKAYLIMQALASGLKRLLKVVEFEKVSASSKCSKTM